MPSISTKNLSKVKNAKKAGAFIDQIHLNDAQYQAVTTTQGPLLIIAGAGTGKTHVITSRILHLLLDKKVPSTQILALTFTEKAALEMQERVDLSMPLSYEEIALKTFHGFCETMLRERGLEIGIDSGYRLLNQTDQWLFLKRNLFAFELDYYRPLGNPNKFLFTLLNHFSRLKDEDIGPEKYLHYAEALLGDARDEVTKEQAQKTLELAKSYAKYQELMMAANLLDFGDLQYYALRLLGKRPSVLAEYQQRFQYILVDEFQDTNFAQNKLVTLLASKHRNLTVVGDDDQAIYKWRGASLSNILNFEKTFPECKKVVLSENYRSTQPILDLSYAVIQNNNPLRLEVQEGISKKLHSNAPQARPESSCKGQLGVPIHEKSFEVAGAAKISGSGPTQLPEIWHFTSYLDEAKAIAQKIQDEIKAGKNPGDFAILVRSNSLTVPYIELLKELEIPFTVRSREGLLHFEEIKDLVALMRFLRNPYDDIAFFRLLCLELFRLPMGSILDVVAQAKKAGYEPLFKYLRTVLKKGDSQESLPGLTESLPFDFVYDLFEYLLDFSKNHAVSRMVGEFLDRSGYYKALTATDTLEHAEKIQRIAQFLEIMKGFEQTHEDRADHSLRAFLEYVELLEEAEFPLEPMLAEAADAVAISTFHSAKGLEFQTVFMPSLVAQRFPAVNRRDALEIPLQLVAEEIPQQDQHLQEERRLFYVGCTRAQKALILSYSDFYEGRKKWKISAFLEEAKKSGALKEKDFTETGAKGEKTAAFFAEKSGGEQDGHSLTHQGLARKGAVGEDRLLYVPAINVNHLSYSQLDTFATCPLKYKFRYLFHLPSPSAHAANFGSSVHNTLNAFYSELKKGVKPSIELLFDLYEQNWIIQGYDSKAHEQARKKEGRAMLERFYAKESQQSPDEASSFIIPAWLERNFRFKIGTFAFTGRIDRIDRLEDGTYEVIDYKTGSSKRDANLSKDLQLSLYAMACQEIFRIKVSKLSLYFLEDLQKNSTSRTTQELEAVKKELMTAAEELAKSDFLPTPGFHCRFCEYRVLCAVAE